MAPSISAAEERVLILAPVGRDGEIACEVLSRARMATVVCTGIDALCEAIGEGAGAVLLTEEALARASTHLLLEACEQQAPW